MIDLTVVDAIEKSYKSRVDSDPPSKETTASAARNRGTEDANGTAGASGSFWACPACTFHNPPGNRVCLMCNQSRPGESGAGDAWSIGYKKKSESNGKFVVRETNYFGGEKRAKLKTSGAGSVPPSERGSGQESRRPEQQPAPPAPRPVVPSLQRYASASSSSSSSSSSSFHTEPRERGSQWGAAQRTGLGNHQQLNRGVTQKVSSSVQSLASAGQQNRATIVAAANSSVACDLEAAQTWIYPTNYPVRRYQQQIVEQVRGAQDLSRLA